jgi:hypothetical protein
MAIRDLFKPKREPEWKHPDVNVRLMAVRHLGSEEQDLIRMLVREDPAAPVRRAALRKVQDIAFITALLAEEKDESVREEACGLLVSAASSNADPDACAAALGALQDGRHIAIVAKAAPLETIRRAALARLADARVLGQVARDADDAETRLNALARIDDPAVLGSVAVGSEHKDVALAAVERLKDADAETLKPIMARARSKAAARRARALLDAIAQSSPASAPTLSPHERRRSLLRLIETFESLARSHDWVRLAREVAEADAKWGELGEGAETALVQRFDAARRILDARVAAHQKEITEAEARERERESKISARTQLCDKADAAAAGDLSTPLDELRDAWDRLERTDDPQALPLADRFRQALATARARQAAEAAAEALGPQAEALCAEAETVADEADVREAGNHMRAIERRWTEAHAGQTASPALLERLQRAVAKLRERQAQTRAEREKSASENAVRIEAVCVQLERLAAKASPNIRDAEKALRESREVLEDLGPLASKEQRDAFTSRLKNARQALYPKVQELKDNVDWQRFANLTVQEELCRRVEAMLPREDIEAVAQELRDVDAQWKQASSVPKDKGEALWARFKTAREQLRTRCDAFFAARAAEQAEHVRKKEALIARAEALAESTEWVKTAQEMQALQAEWKTIPAIPRAQSNALWERFHKACDVFFSRRKQDRTHRREEFKGNREKKEALCVQAEALADSTEWDKTAGELKKLQADWKAIGAVDRQHSEVLWQRFRGACNRFFDRYGKRHDIERAQQQEALEQLCRDMEGLAPDGEAPATDGLAERVAALQTAWRQAGSVAEPAMAALVNRFAAARARVITAAPTAFRGTDLDPENNRKKMEKLCTRLEALVGEMIPRRAETTASLVEQLRNALASNTIGGKTGTEDRWRTAIAELDAAREAWQRIGPVPGDDARALTERFEQACSKLQQERPREKPVGPRDKPAPREKGGSNRAQRSASHPNG